MRTRAEYKALSQYRRACGTGCNDCGAEHDAKTQQCSWRGCGRLYCESCAWHCTECGDVICGEHSKVVNGESYCPSCGDALYEHYEQMFNLLRMTYERNLACPECGGAIEDDSDPLGDREVEERYACYGCGLSATKRRQPSEALRTAQALRYAGGPALPEADYVVTEGAKTRRKPAAAAVAGEKRAQA